MHSTDRMKGNGEPPPSGGNAWLGMDALKTANFIDQMAILVHNHGAHMVAGGKNRECPPAGTVVRSRPFRGPIRFRG